MAGATQSGRPQMVALSTGPGDTLKDRFREIGVAEELVAQCAAIAANHGLKMILDRSQTRGGILFDPSVPAHMGSAWWTKGHASFVAKVTPRALERAVGAGKIRANRVNRRHVLLFAEDVLRWRGLSVA